MRRQWKCLDNEEKQAVRKVISHVRATTENVVREAGLINKKVLINWFKGREHFDPRIVLDTRLRIVQWTNRAKENAKKRIEAFEKKAAETRAWAVERNMSARDVAAKSGQCGNLVPFFDFMLGTNLHLPMTVSAAEEVFKFCKRLQLESFILLTRASWIRWHEIIKEEEEKNKDVKPYSISDEDLQAIATLDVLNLSNDVNNISGVEAVSKRKRDDKSDEALNSETKRRKSKDALMDCPTANSKAANVLVFNV